VPRLDWHGSSPLKGLHKTLKTVPAGYLGQSCSISAKALQIIVADLAPCLQDAQIITADLEASLADILDSKGKDVPGPPASSPAFITSPWAAQPPAMAHQHAPPPAPPSSALAISAAPAAAAAPPEVAARAASPEPELQQEGREEEAPRVAGSFGGLSTDFLQAMQSSLEALGYDLSSADLMQELAGALLSGPLRTAADATNA